MEIVIWLSPLTQRVDVVKRTVAVFILLLYHSHVVPEYKQSQRSNN